VQVKAAAITLVALVSGCSLAGGGRWTAGSGTSGGGTSGGGTSGGGTSGGGTSGGGTSGSSDSRTSDAGQDSYAGAESDAPAASDATTAAALGGLPGTTCQPDREEMARDRGLTGPCWDPPGIVKAFKLQELVRGMRTKEYPDPTMDIMHAIYLFDMPGDVSPTYGYVQIQDHDGNWYQYEPYGTGGFAKPTLPELVGMPLKDALAALDALDLPFVVDVTWDTSCDRAHEVICSTDTGQQKGGYIGLRIATRIRNPGTDKERRLIPGGIEGRAPADVIADLKALGFTNIAVVEKDLPCERGVVCSAPKPGWHPTNQVIELEVRRTR
jgi:hypothetical protein